MESSLTQLGFTSMEEVNTSSLRNAFKRCAALAHPDKGGSEEDFENVLGAYVHLSTILRRQTGGRDGQAVLHAKDVHDARESQFIHELNNMVNEVYDGMDREDSTAFQKQFNEAFEKLHITNEDSKGYDEWFRSKEEEEKEDIENNVQEPMDTEHFHEKFEETVRKGKPTPTAIVLHLDEMAFFGSRTTGTSLIPSSTGYYSDPCTNPEYTDLYAAYTSENTVMDKVPSLNTVRTMEDLLKEREMVDAPLVDQELEAMYAYEQRKVKMEQEHMAKITDYFASTASSQWALHNKLA